MLHLHDLTDSLLVTTSHLLKRKRKVYSVFSALVMLSQSGMLLAMTFRRAVGVLVLTANLGVQSSAHRTTRQAKGAVNDAYNEARAKAR